jgi:hypothetical protein
MQIQLPSLKKKSTAKAFSSCTLSSTLKVVGGGGKKKKQFFAKHFFLFFSIHLLKTLHLFIVGDDQIDECDRPRRTLSLVAAELVGHAKRDAQQRKFVHNVKKKTRQRRNPRSIRAPPPTRATYFANASTKRTTTTTTTHCTNTFFSFCDTSTNA